MYSVLRLWRILVIHNPTVMFNNIFAEEGNVNYMCFASFQPIINLIATVSCI